MSSEDIEDMEVTRPCAICDGTGEKEVLVTPDPSEPHIQELDVVPCDCQIKEEEYE